MKEYLDTLKRQQLIKLYSAFGIDKIKCMSLNNNELKKRLLDEQILTKDTAESFLNKGITKQDLTATKEVVQAIKENTQQELEVTDDATVIISKVTAKEQADTKSLSLRMRKKAMEPLVVTIQSLSTRDIEAGKKSDTIYFANEYFSVAKVVPFGVKCELPRCIVEIAKEALAPVYTAFESFADQRKAGVKGVYRMQPKYSVIIHGKSEELKKSKELEKELGL